MRKLVFRAGGANSEGADPRGPICAVVIHLLESIISKLASSKILFFQLVSVAVQAGLNLTVRNPEDRVCHIEAHILSINNLLYMAIHDQIYLNTPIHSGKQQSYMFKLS